MYKKSKSKLNIYQNKVVKNNHNLNLTNNITYNKPLFINMKNEINNNNYINYNLNIKNSSCSTKICSANSESSLNGSDKNNIYNSNKVNYDKDFDIEKNYSKTSKNFFSKHINTSISSSEDNNYNYETFTPSRKNNHPFNEDEEEQFTPYLGQKNSSEKSNKNTIKNSFNKNDDKSKNSKYSNIFNNSREIIESASLNLKTHFERQLSNKYKNIDKFQKLSVYQKKKEINDEYKMNNKNNSNPNYKIFVKLKGSPKKINRQILYKKKFDLDFHRENERKILEWFYIHNIDISQREIYEKYAVLIQTIFRGYLSRIVTHNKLILRYVSVFIQTLNNIYIENKKYIRNYCFQKIYKFRKTKEKIFNISNTSFTIEGNDNKNKTLCQEIKELINQNNNLQLKLNEFLINNNILKNDIINYKEIELKYNNLLIQLEKLQNVNNNIFRENNRLTKELNTIKNRRNIKNYIITSTNEINLSSKKSNINDKNNTMKICKNINNIIIKSPNKKYNIIICSNVNNISITKNYNSSIKFKILDICKNINNIEIKNIISINKFKKLDICNNLNNISLYPSKSTNRNIIFQIEKQNIIMIPKINIIKNNKKVFIIEKKENFFINNSPTLNIYKSTSETDNNINNTIQINNNSKKDEKENIHNIILNSFLSNNSSIYSSTNILEQNQPYRDILADEPNLYEDEKNQKNIVIEKNEKDNEKIINERNSLRISLRDEKIESQEVKLESEETNLSKEEILKRKKLRDLFKNKLFMLRDITRKYFLRFYYNGIYIKMVGKKPRQVKFARCQTEPEIRKKSQTPIQKGQILRRRMSQRAKAKKDTLRKYFFMFRQEDDLKNIRKKLIEYKKKKDIRKNELLNSIIDKNENGDFNFLNLKRWMIIWKYKNKKMKKKELNQFCGEGNENNELKFDQSEDINNEKESEQNDDEDSIEAFIKNNLINRTCILKKNEVFI